MHPDDEFLERFDALEKKVDAIYSKLDQAMGAWLVIKILSTVAVGFTVLYTFLGKHWQ